MVPDQNNLDDRLATVPFRRQEDRAEQARLNPAGHTELMLPYDHGGVQDDECAGDRTRGRRSTSGPTLERLSVTHALRTGGLAGSRVVHEACEDVEKQATQKFRVRLKRPPRKVEILRNRMQGRPAKAKNAARAKAEQDWESRLRACQMNAREDRCVLTTARSNAWNPHRHHLHDSLLKAESTVTLLLQTEHTGMK